MWYCRPGRAHSLQRICMTIPRSLIHTKALHATLPPQPPSPSPSPASVAQSHPSSTPQGPGKGQDRRRAGRRLYWLKNKEEIQERGRQYRLENKQEIQARLRSYRLRNTETVRERGIKYYSNHKEAIRERRRLLHKGPAKGPEQGGGAAERAPGVFDERGPKVFGPGEAVKERMRKYYLKHREAIKEGQKVYRRNNRDIIKERIKRYRMQNLEAIKERQKEYRLKNLLTIQEVQKKYRMNNKEVLTMKRKEYHKKNLQLIKEIQRRYRTNNNKTIKEKQKQYRLNNKEIIQEQQKKYRVANVLMIREKQRQYYIQNKGTLLERAKLRSKKNRKAKIWNHPEQVRRFFEGAMAQLYVSQPSDWYRISRMQISRIGGGSLYNIFGSLGKALRFAFPEMEWDISKFSFRGKKAAQRWLRVMLQLVLPDNTDVMEDYLHPMLFWDEEGKYNMELDIWVPKYKIALEYQGEHHYYDLCFAYGPSGTLSLYANRDLKKKQTCAQMGITLVTIPFWWDGTKESLASTLAQIRPDIFPQMNVPQIPSSPPTDTLNDARLKRNQLTTFLMHGLAWNRQDPTGWFMSEKLDGVRAFWDGTKLYSRSGNEFLAPPEFIRAFPRGVCLDGELWTGYDDIGTLSSILRKTALYLDDPPNLSQLWKEVKFCVFDAPLHPGNYFERHSFASKSVSGPNISVIPTCVCLGFQHLYSTLSKITSKRGEGLMLFHPSAKYTSGRTYNLFKVKETLEEDVKFLEINSNSYSFLCEQKNGVECVVKCSSWDYLFPPQPGTVLTVTHNGWFNTSQKMKYPILLRVRNDLNWKQIQTETTFNLIEHNYHPSYKKGDHFFNG